MSFVSRVRVFLVLGGIAGMVLVGAPSASAAICPDPNNPECDHSSVQVGPGGVQGNAIVASNGRGGVRLLAGGGDCLNCQWKIVPACWSQPSDGTGPGPNACGDTSPSLRCEVPGVGGEGIQYDRLYSPTGTPGTWTLQGFICVGRGERPISTNALFAQVRRYVDQLVPAAPKVSMQPAGVTIVRLPTLFQAGQSTDPANRTASKVFFTNAGAQIAINVTVTPDQWTWAIDGQATTISRDYCCRYYTSEHSPRANPDYYASHTFDSTGSHTATVTVTWSATMTISGLGTVPVDGTFTRSSTAYPFQVKQARSQLENGG